MKKLVLLISLLFAFSVQSQITKVQGVGYKAITTTQRDALVVPATEYWRIYNSTTDQYEYWNGTAWADFGAAGGTQSPLTTKGDVYTYDTDNQRLGIGTDGQVLTADSAEPTGIKWTTLAGSGDVVKVPTPVNNQIAIWTGDGTLEGTTNITFDGSSFSVTGTGTHVINGTETIIKGNTGDAVLTLEDFGGTNSSSIQQLTTGDFDFKFETTGTSDLSFFAGGLERLNIDELGVATFTGIVKGIDGVADEDLVTKSQLDDAAINSNDHFAIPGSYTTLLADDRRKGIISGVSVITLDDAIGITAEYAIMIYNRSGVDVEFDLGASQQTDQFGFVDPPNLSDNHYAYIELIANDVWSISVGGASGTGAVDSVNGYTGTVVLDNDDVGALPTDMNIIQKGVAYETTEVEGGYYVEITADVDITLRDNGMADGWSQIVYNSSGADIALVNYAGNTIEGINNPIPTGYHATYVLIGVDTWSVSTPAVAGAIPTHTGDVTGDTDLTIGADKVLESHLKAVDTPNDEEYLTYEATTGDFEWQAGSGGAYVDLTTNQSVAGQKTFSDVARFTNAGGIEVEDKILLEQAGAQEFTIRENLGDIEMYSEGTDVLKNKCR